jgi:multiple sugar transport system permease protein
VDSFYVSVLTVLITLLFSCRAPTRWRGCGSGAGGVLALDPADLHGADDRAGAADLHRVLDDGLRNTILGIVLIYPVTTIPVALYMLQGYFRGASRPRSRRPG